MKAIEVWINGEKKCVAGTNDNVLVSTISATIKPHVRVGGAVKKEGTTFYTYWLDQPLQVGDEVRVRLIETDEVDAPHTEKRAQTQAERDDKIRAYLLEAHVMLPALSESQAESAALFEERMEEQNFVAAMHILAELGTQNSMPASYWKALRGVAFLLQHYNESGKYREKERALTPQDEESQ